jgi:hypothetical protein
MSMQKHIMTTEYAKRLLLYFTDADHQLCSGHSTVAYCVSVAARLVTGTPWQAQVCSWCIIVQPCNLIGKSGNDCRCQCLCRCI